MQARKFSVIRSRWAIAVAAVSLAIGLGAAAAPRAAGPAGLIKVRFGGDEASTRVVVELSRTSQAKLISSGQPVVIELPHIDVGAEREGRGQGLVRAWSADGGPGAARVTLELTRSARIERRFMLAPTEGAPNYRYVIDLRADGAAVPAAPSKAASAMIAEAAPKLLAASNAKPISLKKVIVIDAGHGGHDPGALGENVQEKAITLAAAKALKTKLESTGRYRVVLTRDSDTFIPLDSRVQIARRAGADLFISLHADAGANKATRGASVYTLSDKGSERVQRTLASGQGGFLHIRQAGGNLAVSQILLDLTQRATRNKSTSFAQRLVDEISDVTPLLENTRRDAAYRVLLAPDVPAVLLEMGFITNRSDEAFLRQASRRQKLIDAVAEAIDAYFNEEQKLAAR